MISPRPTKIPFKGQKSHQKILLVILLYALLFSFGGGIGNVHAQDDKNVSLKARAGFDGYCKENQWVPIHVEVENKGPDLKADIQVSYKKAAGGKSLTSMNIDLPATSRKEFFLYAYSPEGYNQGWSVTLLANGKVLKKVSLAVNCLALNAMIFGVLTDNPATYDVLNDTKPVSGFVRVAQLDLSDLPDRAQAWPSLDALIVSNVDTGTLSPEQKQALTTWIAKGGKLFIVGGINWQNTTAGLKDLMPVELNTTRRVDSLSELQAYVKDELPLDSQATLASGRVQAEARTLLSQDGVPLIVQKPLGFGSVYFFAADPALQPLSNWDGMKEVYQHLLAARSQLPAWADGSWYDYRASQALATIPELGLPSFLYICGLLVLYIIIIGPINYFVLRRLKRRELAWVTIPVIVVIFTCLAYATGFSFRGVTPILNRLILTQAWDGVEQSHVQAMVGIYSPLRTKYDLEATGGFMFQPFKNSDGNLQANNWNSLQRGPDMIMPAVPVEIGDMKEIVVEGALPALEIKHDLVLTISKVSPVISGEITNNSQYTIKDAILVTSGDWKRLGDIKPGQVKKVDVSLVSSSNGPAFYNLDSASILNTNYAALQTNVETARRSAFLDTVLFTDYGSNYGNWGIYLMGWVDQIGIPAGLKDKKFDTINTMLYIDRLSPAVKIEAGELKLPMSLFTWESSEPSISAYYAGEVAAGGYTLRFQPAFPISFGTVKSMNLYLTSNAAYQDLVISAWDYELRKWVIISVTGSNTNIPEPNRYLGPDNEIKLKVASNRSDWTEITASNISLVVQP